MEEATKTYVFDSASGSKGSSLDPNVLLAMMNNGGGFGGNNGSWLWIIFLFFLYGWGGRGFGGFGNGGGLANEVNNDYGRELLSQAIAGNRTAISELSTNLNCSVGQIQSAINSVQASVQNVGNQVGMSGMQVINAIQSGNQTLASQLAQCCCDNKLLVTTQGYENRIANAEQTALLGGKIDAQTTFLSDKFCDLEKREMQSKIDSLREKNSTLQAAIDNANQTAQIQAYVASAITPVNAALAGLQGEVNGIKCRMPETQTVPANNGVYLPACIASQYGLYGTPSVFTNAQWA